MDQDKPQPQSMLLEEKEIGGDNQCKTENISDCPNNPGGGPNCSSVIIDIEVDEGPEKDVVLASDSDTEFEDDGGSKRKDDGDDDDLVSLEPEMNVNEESTSSNNDLIEQQLPSGKISQAQALAKEVQEEMLLVEERNKKLFDQLKRLGPSDRIFPDVRASNFHTVTFTLTDDFKPGDSLAPYPATFISTWDRDYVPLPCCPENIRVVRKRIDEPTDQAQNNSVMEVKILMWERIRSALTRPVLSCRELAGVIKSYTRINGPFDALEYALDVLMGKEQRTLFFSRTLPGIVKLCLDLPNIVTGGIPFLSRFMNYSITLSQKQIACLLANAFLSTFPERFDCEEDFPSINFVSLFTSHGNDSRLPSMGHKLLCIIHYFERVLDEMPNGVVTFTRKSVRSAKHPDWSKLDKKLSQLITLHNGNIETDGAQLLQIDFANKFLGGGVLGQGCVQEEILFVIYPELLISRLFTERLVSCEALVVTGCERFSTYHGYASSFEFAGDFYDTTPVNSRARKCTQMVAIDAQYVVRHTDQFHPQKLAREVNKAYIGFTNPFETTGSNVAVATGKWGCGAFKGDAHLKTIVQLMAASLAGRDLVLFTFGDLFLQKEVEEIYLKIKYLRIREVWILLEQYNKLFCSRQQRPALNLYEFFTEYINPSSADPSPPAAYEEQGSTDRDPSIEQQGCRNPQPASSTYTTANAKKRPIEKSDGGDWLHKLENTKAQLKPFQPEAAECNFDFDDKQKLNCDQIASMLDGSESMEVESADTSRKIDETKDSTSNLGTGVNKQFPEDDSKSPPISKRCKIGISEGSSSPTSTSSTIPKQRRQITLQDFYKPLQ